MKDTSNSVNNNYFRMFFTRGQMASVIFYNNINYTMSKILADQNIDILPSSLPTGAEFLSLNYIDFFLHMIRGQGERT